MKYIKKYEKLNKTPEIGGYVYCETDDVDNTYIPKNFIGILTNILPDRKKWPYRVKYPLISTNSDNDDPDRLIGKHEVIDWSKTQEELEHYIAGNKYNI